MDALYYLGLLVSILIIVYQFSVQRRFQHKDLPPSPPSLPIIGHFHLLKTPVHQALNNLSNKYGPIFLLRLGSRPTLVLSSQSAIEECFPNNDIIFSNRPLLPSKKILQYNYTTIAAPYGNHWRNLRRFTALEIFSAKRLQMSSDIRTEEIRFMIKHLCKRSFEGVVLRKVNVKSFFYLLDFNIMLKMVAGKRCFEEELDLDKTTKGKLDDLKETFGPFLNMALGDYFPYLRWLTYYGVEKQQMKTHKKRDAFIQALLDARQNKNNSLMNSSVPGGEINLPIIDVLLKLHESEPEFYTNNVIKGIIQSMLVAGTHTTVVTLDLVVSQLMAHPEAFKKARDEIDNHVGDYSRLLNDSDLFKLPYLHSIISETLRLGPLTILPARESSEDCTVGGYHIPRGTQLLVNAWAVHRDPALWIEPDRFKPERFLQSEEEKQGGCKFISFGLGRRVCPGEGLGMRVMGLSLGILIQCFEWEEVKDDSQVPIKKTNLNKQAEERPVNITFRPREALTKVLAQL
ncbi:hypothetical protein JRO89_XS07G0080300 [Xanthoceras sorbifolium]|uniref:Cytochrome P450 n=1 Tax=Xanthoceras sorbifolium TaxID=99658 RepID=A0ABQ8HT17_9ROSI|nr:hypothetical protein JRO89_XS07G0080300 [Xanthoceras sorbifolium]